MSNSHLKRRTGPAGANGNTILYGTVDPTTEGVDGNFYINTTSNYFFGPKSGGSWPGGFSITGPQGPTGPAGTNGTNGLDGNTILYGTSIPAGGLGIDGNFYIRTTTNFLYGPKTAGAWGSGTSLVGPQGPTGPAGAAGNTVLFGSGVPSGGLGVDGNFYINTATNFLYGPKTAGAWGSGTSLVGPPGSGISESLAIAYALAL